eukprot:TRINITY_DN61021_c0_g1_i1.p1 TRINITY_DN61021_c0_g1~~TRINITY_DN61021_c0_g1_i1.p1  ORF type:complete len:454 (+),score=38.37 TRINITY_DN61021_c0_g1_i1:59-1420(+)
MKKTGEGYQGFGSFMTPSVDDMLDNKVPMYLPAEFLPAVPQDAVKKCSEFGTDSCRQLWPVCASTKTTFVNHGAFGVTPFPSLTAFHQVRQSVEAEPLAFFDRTLFYTMVNAIKRLSTVVNCKPKELSLVPNCTFGLNAVLNSLLDKDSTVLLLDITYGSIKKIALGSNIVWAHIPLTCANAPDKIVDIVRDVLQANEGKVKLAVFDHITSNTALLMPVQELTELCHSFGVPVLVDGAHALFATPLNIEKINADFYVGNCHKWFSCPRGCGFLWVKSKWHNQIKNPIKSHGSGSGFSSDFMWWGNTDYTPALMVPYMVDWWDAVGWQSARDYCNKLLHNATTLLCKSWNVSRVVTNPSSLCCCMALVALPKHTQGKKMTSVQSKLMQDNLFHVHHIQVPVKCIDDNLYVRISCMVYNNLEDYKTLANAVLNLLPELPDVFGTHADNGQNSSKL